MSSIRNDLVAVLTLQGYRPNIARSVGLASGHSIG